MPAYYQIRRLVLNTSEFKPIKAPMDCSRVVLTNGDSANSQYIRSDANDGGTEHTLPPAAELTIQAAGHVAPFEAGTTICYMRSSSGAGPVIASFTR